MKTFCAPGLVNVTLGYYLSPHPYYFITPAPSSLGGLSSTPKAHSVYFYFFLYILFCTGEVGGHSLLQEIILI